MYTQSDASIRTSAEKYRDLTADRWDRWLFDHGPAGVLLGVTLAGTVMGLIGHTLVGGSDRRDRRGCSRSRRRRTALRELSARGRRHQRIRAREYRPPTVERILAEHADHRVADGRRRMASQPPRGGELAPSRNRPSARLRLDRDERAPPPTTRPHHRPRNRGARSPSKSLRVSWAA